MKRHTSSRIIFGRRLNNYNPRGHFVSTASKQTSIKSFFAQTTEPLESEWTFQPTTPTLKSKKPRVGRPKKNPPVNPCPDFPVTPSQPANCPPPVNPSAGSPPPANQPADLLSPAILPADSAGPSTSGKSPTLRARYSIAQKKKVALYA